MDPNLDCQIAYGVVVVGCQPPCPKHPGRPDSGTCGWRHILHVNLQQVPGSVDLQQVPGSVDLQQVPGYLADAAENVCHDLKKKKSF
jgi:hypothetical protein